MIEATARAERIVTYSGFEKTRIRRLSLGLAGDVRAVGGGVLELRIHHGPEYRVYFTRLGPTIILLLLSGDKRSQDRDIAAAIEMATNL